MPVLTDTGAGVVAVVVSVVPSVDSVVDKLPVAAVWVVVAVVAVTGTVELDNAVVVGVVAAEVV